MQKYSGNLFISGEFSVDSYTVCLTPALRSTCLQVSFSDQLFPSLVFPFFTLRSAGDGAGAGRPAQRCRVLRVGSTRQSWQQRRRVQVPPAGGGPQASHRAGGPREPPSPSPGREGRPQPRKSHVCRGGCHLGDRAAKAPSPSRAGHQRTPNPPSPRLPMIRNSNKAA